MTKMKVYEYPAPVLRQKAKPVEKVTDELRKTLDDMLETMYDDDGVGLAANQVGLLDRILVIDVSQGKPHPYKIINPKIIAHSDETACGEEGCLSVPHQSASVTRYKTVTVEYLDENGEKQTLKGEGLLAVALQHEMDHLDGKLFIDYLSPLKRNILLRKLKKSQKYES